MLALTTSTQLGLTRFPQQASSTAMWAELSSLLFCFLREASLSVQIKRFIIIPSALIRLTNSEFFICATDDKIA